MRRELAIAIIPGRPDRRFIYEWARDHVTDIPGSPIRGRFDIRNSPWLRRPFETLTDPLCRHTTLIKPVQTGGTLLAELAVAYRIANDPGPCSFTFQSDEMAAMEAKTRMMPMLDSIGCVARLLPRAGPLRTQQEIFMGNQFLVLNSANLAHQQSQSIRWKINDEIWMPRWAEIYPHAVARVSAFEAQGISHILDISQGGVEGDTAWSSFDAGTREFWHADCQGCGKPMPLRFRCKREDGTRAGVVWEKDARRDDGTFNTQRAAETARFVCPHCGHEHADTDRTRHLWRQSGQYLTPDGAKPARRRVSFNYEAIVALPMETLAAQFCAAENAFAKTGDETERKNFMQKKEARFWVEEHNTIEIFSGSEKSGYTTQTYKGAAVAGEVGRHMTLDRQKDHWWVEIGAWSTQPTLTYRQLFFGRVDSLGMARTLQAEYGVQDWAVAQDRAYMPSEVDRDCLNYGWSGLEGSKTKRKRWTQRDEASGKIVAFPTSDVFLSPINGTTVPYAQFDGEYFKDLLSTALSKEGGITWMLPEDANPLWFEHIAGEEKKEVRPGVFEWHETKNNADNHGLDTSVMQLVIASVRGIIQTKPEENT
jgi:hypothetical protein